MARMAIRYPLVLANFGAGAASLKPVYDGLFKRVIIDKTLFSSASPSSHSSLLCARSSGK
jgi:hypothetical protein